MSKLTKMNEMAIQQLTGFMSAYRGSSIDDLVVSMGMGFEEWETIRSEVKEWLPEKLVSEIDEYFEAQQ